MRQPLYRERSVWIRVVLAASVIAVVGLFGMGCARPQEAAVPERVLTPGERVLKASVDASGGRAAFDAIRNRLAKGTLEMPAQGITMNMTVYQARPDKNYTIIESDIVGTIEKGVTDGVVWEKNVMTGPAVKEGAERDEGLQSAQFDRMTYWEDAFTEVVLEEPAEVEGVQCDKVTAHAKVGHPQTLYFNAQTHLLKKIEGKAETQMGVIPVVAVLSDYRPVDGIMIPHQTTLNQLGQKILVKLSSVEHNVEMAPDRFDLPKDIQKLADKLAEKEAAAKAAE